MFEWIRFVCGQPTQAVSQSHTHTHPSRQAARVDDVWKTADFQALQIFIQNHQKATAIEGLPDFGSKTRNKYWHIEFSIHRFKQTLGTHQEFKFVFLKCFQTLGRLKAWFVKVWKTKHVGVFSGVFESCLGTCWISCADVVLCLIVREK